MFITWLHNNSNPVLAWQIKVYDMKKELYHSVLIHCETNNWNMPE